MSPNRNQQKIEANKKLVGKTVNIVTNEEPWYGEVVSVIDAETFLVKREDEMIQVDIFDIRGS